MHAHNPCRRCGDPSDGWPSNEGGELCQMCWEAQCSEEWWEAISQSEPVADA